MGQYDRATSTAGEGVGHLLGVLMPIIAKPVLIGLVLLWLVAQASIVRGERSARLDRPAPTIARLTQLASH